MHHPNSVRPLAMGSLLLGLLLGSTVLAQTPAAGNQAAKPGPAGPQSAGIIIPLNGTQKVQISTKRNIASVNNPRPNIVRVQPVANDPTSILITGLEAGITQLT